ncbi:MAG TPA: hypothetical protein VKN18_15075 [Blastocatellia bacterium]|nr:hypothetical protein [Blastocatellia bacterium]
MLKRIIATAIAVMLIQTVCLLKASASTKEEKQAQRAEKVRSAILKLGVGPDARVALKLRDNAKLAGYISSANDDSFVVTSLKTGNTATVVYNDVTQVKGNNLSTGASIAIGIAIGVGATFLLLFVYAITHED